MAMRERWRSPRPPPALPVPASHPAAATPFPPPGAVCGAAALNGGGGSGAILSCTTTRKTGATSTSRCPPPPLSTDQHGRPRADHRLRAQLHEEDEYLSMWMPEEVVAGDRLSPEQMLFQLLAFLALLGGVGYAAVLSNPEGKNPVHPKVSTAYIPAGKEGFPGSAK